MFLMMMGLSKISLMCWIYFFAVEGFGMRMRSSDCWCVKGAFFRVKVILVGSDLCRMSGCSLWNLPWAVFR